MSTSGSIIKLWPSHIPSLPQKTEELKDYRVKTNKQTERQDTAILPARPRMKHFPGTTNFSVDSEL